MRRALHDAQKDPRAAAFLAVALPDGGAGVFRRLSGDAGPAHSRLDAASAQVSALTEQRDQLVREIGELQEEIDFVQTDAYVERAARDELGLIMPGEVRYVNAAS